MREIKVWCKGGKFALSVDGAYQNIESEDDMLNKLLELEITRERADDVIRRLKQTQEPIQVR